MPRFFISDHSHLTEDSPLPENITLTGEDAFHLSVSLRARIGDRVQVCTPSMMEILCIIQSISGGKKDPVVSLQPLEMKLSRAESPVFLTLFQGFPKGKKCDSILQKATELGVSRIVFVYSDRSVPNPSGEEKKEGRFQKICDEAAKQCGRGKLVEVSICPDTESAIRQMKEADLAFACFEEETGRSMKELLRAEKYESVAFFIGPEGGISSREVDLFREAGIPTVTLGNRILRTETASSTVLSAILYEKEL